jgi:GrpB-like predicted nucleotidyltransferase (UPF0157 family)
MSKGVQARRRRSETGPGSPAPPTTEEQLRRITIGELRPVDAPITLSEYDPRWPELYSQEEQRIRVALGDRAERIEHVGSTSVPGLVAKPILDILLVVADSSDEPSYVPALEHAGFVLRIREPDWHEHRLFKRPGTNLNLHVFSGGSTEIDRMLTFRDVLRADSTSRERYAATKRELAARTWKYVQNYADAKSEVVAAILATARSAGRRKGRSTGGKRRASGSSGRRPAGSDASG